jgi:WD40 repeat protein
MLKLWSAEDWEIVRNIELKPKGTYPISFSSDGKVIAVGADYNVLLFAVDDGTLLEEVPIKAKGVYSVAFSPDGRWLASGSADKKIRIWELV